MKKIIRITTVPVSLKILLRDQLKFMNQYFEMIAISSKNGLQEILDEQGIRGYAVDMTRKITPVKDLVALFNLVYIFIKEKPDIVHTHTPKAGILGMSAAWIARVPHRLHTVAGMPLLVYSGKKRKLLEFVEFLTYKFSTKVYPNSFVLKNIILDLGLVPLHKIKVIGNGSSNGINTSYFSPDTGLKKRNEIREKYGIKKDDFVFIFVGRIVKDKGINELISSFSELSGKYDAVKLILIGPFEKELDPIEEMNEREIEINQSIINLGYQSDIRSYLLASDALVFPSYREGFPNVVLQAGAMGLPSIVTDINGCNEIIEDGINGVIISPQNQLELYNSMEYFFKNKSIVKKMGGKSREMVTSRFEQKKVWEALLSEYKSLN